MLTQEILVQAYINECETQNVYDMYAYVARKEGYIKIAQLFEEFALHELSHAKNLLKFIDNSHIECTLQCSLPQISTTLANIKNAIRIESTDAITYLEYSNRAKVEGHTKIAAKFKTIAIAEEFHKKQFEKLAFQLENNMYFYSNVPIEWYCIKCGYVHFGESAPHECPACNHLQGYFTQVL